MLKKFFISLFALPFLGFGLGFGYIMVWPDAYDSYRAQSWTAVPVTLTHAKLERSRSSDSTTYGVSVTYHYTFYDEQFSSQRAAISDGKDNIGDFQQKLGRQLERAFKNGTTVYAWVNPDNPQEAVLNRDFRWGLFALKSIFSVIFSIVGFAVLYGALSSKKKRKTNHGSDTTTHRTDKTDTKTPTYSSQNAYWKTDRLWSKTPIYSGVMTKLWGSWIFSIIWLALSSPAAFALPKEISRGNYGILVILIFLAIGFGVLAFAIRETWAFIRFGRAPLTLNPHPGNLGGQIGGSIALNLPYDSNHEAIIRLTHLHTYTTGSGKNRSTRNTIIWQQEQKAVMTRDRNGSIASFLFAPSAEDLRPSERPSRSYHHWQVTIDIDLPGPDISRTYEIPVFPTGDDGTMRIAEYSDRALVTSAHARLYLKPVREGMTQHIRFPKKRAVLVQLPLVLIGISGMVLLSEVFLPLPRIGTIPSILLWIASIACTWITGYLLGRSTHIALSGRKIERRTSMFGIPTGKVIIHTRDIQKIYHKETSSSQTGNEVKSHRGIYVDHGANDTTCIGYGIDGTSMADLVVDEIKQIVDID